MLVVVGKRSVAYGVISRYVNPSRQVVVRMPDENVVDAEQSFFELLFESNGADGVGVSVSRVD